ncbi:MAG TPA: MFS transporter, partial [Blastocatellia bacterium]|nr:MFS transporter [Blastocatellia bacterium]
SGQRTGLGRVFKAFYYRDFRLMWFGACTSSVGTWMQNLAQSWLVYDISGSAFYLGLDAFLAQAPIILFTLFGGVLADRKSRRHILLFSQYLQMFDAFMLAALLFFGYRHIWPILVLSFLTGTAQSFGGPAYSALIPTLVDAEDLPNAIALNSIQFNLARVIGPVIGGVTLKLLGAVWCFGLNGLSFIAVIFSLYMIRVSFTPKPSGESVRDSMRAGFDFIRQREGMVPLILLAFAITAIAFPMIAFLPVFARTVFQAGPGTYTALLASSGVGSVIGALIFAGSGKKRGLGKSALITLMCLGLVMTSFALSRQVFLSCFFLFLSGAVLLSVFAMITSLVQMITPDNMRGRVMSVYNGAFRGGMPLGSIVAGAIIQRWSAPPVIAIDGVLIVLLGCYFLFVHRRVAAL